MHLGLMIITVLVALARYRVWPFGVNYTVNRKPVPLDIIVLADIHNLSLLTQQ